VTRDHQELRLRALGKLNEALGRWAAAYRKEAGIDYMTNANLYCLKVAGSFRFGVYTESSDIDVLLIGSIYIEPHVFFTSISESLASTEGITSVLNIPKTRVPIIALEVDGIPVDLLLASTSMALLPDPFDPLDASLMESTDSKTLQSLNSARVTDYVLRHATSPVFVPLLKLVRLWAKARGVFGAKYGYLGGVQWCLCILSLLQRREGTYGSSSLAHMVGSFFEFMATTDWARQTLALRPLPHDVGTRNWYSDSRKYDESMVVLTPTQPYTNTTYNVNPNSMIHLLSEFQRAHGLVQEGQVAPLFAPWLAKPIVKHVKPLARSGFEVFLHAGFSVVKDGGGLDEYASEKGRIDSKLRMLGLSILKTHRKVIGECRLLIKSHEANPGQCQWIFGLCLTRTKRTTTPRIDLQMLLDSFRSEMKLCHLRSTQLVFQPMTFKQFKLWLKDVYFQC
jgi:poly(A) polymerase